VRHLGRLALGATAALLPLAVAPPARAWVPPPASSTPSTSAPSSPPASAATSPPEPAAAAVPSAAGPPPEATAPPAGAPPPPGPRVPQARLHAPFAGPTVRLHVNNPRARLQQQELELRWTDVCAAPCGIVVDPRATYRLGGGTLRATDPFQMPRPAGVVLVDGNMGSNVKHWVGIGLTIAGALDAVAGSLWLVAAQHATGNYSGDLSKKDYYTATGVVGLITGAILLGVGIGLTASGSSSVEVR
jgi:hypothetical protein